jgi:hypothetical protein
MAATLPEPALTSAKKPPVPLTRELDYRRRQAAGLAILAAVTLAFSLWRSGLAAVFPQGWWRVW